MKGMEDENNFQVIEINLISISGGTYDDFQKKKPLRTQNIMKRNKMLITIRGKL